MIIIKYQKLYLTCIALFIITLTQAQLFNDPECWNTFGLKWTLNEKFSFQGESQVRSSGLYREFYHVDAKFNAYYSMNDMIRFVAGTGRYNVFTKGGDFVKPLVFTETRIWEEINLEKTVSRFIFENRDRLEQRFTSDGYKNRFKIRFGLTIPLNHPSLIPKTIYAYIYDDIFYVKKIEVNRIFGGFGYKAGFLTFQAGWMHQVKYTTDIKDYLNVLMVSMIVEIKHRRI